MIPLTQQTAGLFDAPSNSGRVFSKDFVIAALTYLCSRLVQPSIQERSAITIQRAFRRTLFQANLHRRINLLMLAHRCADVVNRKHAAITIQRAYRRFLHDKIQKLIACITGVQALGRGAIARGRAEERRRAAVVIQRMWREVREARFRRRIGVASRAVVGVQALSRGVAVRRWVAAVKRGVGIVEPRRETILLARRAREAYLNKRGAARVIQRAWRRYDGTREERRGLVEVREAIVGVQALARGWMVRVRGAELLAAVTELQRRYRQAMEARRARTQYSDLRNAALVVQRRRRETVQARERHHDFLLIRQVVAVIKQRFVQKKQELGAALVLQRAWRERAWIVRMHRTAREATVIQSAWRGYLVRKECGPRLRIVRRRVRKTLETPVRVGETIGARTRAALEMVKSSKAGFGRGVAVLGLFPETRSGLKGADGGRNAYGKLSRVCTGGGRG